MKKKLTKKAMKIQQELENIQFQEMVKFKFQAHREIYDMSSKGDIIYEEVEYEPVKGYFERQVQAVKELSKNICHICDKPIKFDYPNFNDVTGRMYNIEGSKKLDPAHWISLCVDCHKKLMLQEQMNEGFVPYE